MFYLGGTYRPIKCIDDVCFRYLFVWINTRNRCVGQQSHPDPVDTHFISNNLVHYTYGYPKQSSLCVLCV